MKKIKLVAAALLLAALVLFLLQNLRMIEVSFLLWSAELPIALPLIAAFFVGGLAARPLIRFLKGQRRVRKDERAAGKAASKAAAKAAAAQTEVRAEAAEVVKKAIKD